MRCEEEEKIYFHLSQKYFYSKSRYLHWPPLLFTSPNFSASKSFFLCFQSFRVHFSKAADHLFLRLHGRIYCWFFGIFKLQNKTFWVIFKQNYRKYHRSKSWSKKLIFWPPTTLRSARFFGRTLVSSRKKSQEYLQLTHDETNICMVRLPRVVIIFFIKKSWQKKLRDRFAENPIWHLLLSA